MNNKAVVWCVFLMSIVLCCMPFVSPPYALFLGLILSLFIRNPLGENGSALTGFLLKASIVGLGFGVNLNTALEVGKQGFLYTVISIVLTLVVGVLLGKLFQLDKVTAYLVAVGTAICGGSAIAATAPAVSAKGEQISVALAVVFILNAVALFVFPTIGQYFNMSQEQFGVWCAIAIHDTSSVVGAASVYGEEALTIATTVKLVRALWIIPVVLITVLLFKEKGVKVKMPYFIGFFVLAMLLSTKVEAVQEISPYVVRVSKVGFTITLFFIGLGLSPQTLKKVGARSFVQGVVLWLMVSVVSIFAILSFVK